MNQPPGPPPPYGPPPYGPPPEPPPSRLRPPWRDAPPEERTLVILWAVLGFLLPWVILVLGIVLAILGHPLGTVICVAVTLLLDLAGFIVMMVVDRRQVRGAAYGSFAGCLTHVITAAIAFLVFFGWCVSALNNVN